MNLSNFAHGALAVAAQLVLALIASALGADFFMGTIIGGAFGIGFYFGREVTQAEVKAWGDPWYIGFEIRLWSKDAIYDLVVPTVACLLVCIACLFWE